MTGFASFASKIASFKALVLKDSISPKFLGSFLEDLLGFTRKNAEDIASEAEARQAADDALEVLIDNEASIRQSSYEELQAAIDKVEGALGGLRLQEISEDGYQALLESDSADGMTLYLVTENNDLTAEEE